MYDQPYLTYNVIHMVILLKAFEDFGLSEQAKYRIQRFVLIVRGLLSKWKQSLALCSLERSSKNCRTACSHQRGIGKIYFDWTAAEAYGSGF